METTAEEPLPAQFDALIETFQGSNVDLSHGAPGLQLIFHGEGGFTHFPPSLVGLPADWEGFSALRLIGEANVDGAFTLRIVGSTADLFQTFTCSGGKTETLTLPLDELPLANRADAPFQPHEARIICDGSWQLHIKELSLVPRDGPAPACIDPFGQRRFAEWEDKATSTDNLKAACEKEAAQLEKADPPHARAESGGWNGGARFPAAGYFKLGRTVNQRWWLIDPEGHPFWALGVGVSNFGGPDSRTEVEARPCVFEDAPEDGDFLKRNLEQKYGGFEAWASHMGRRYRHLGLTCVGPGTNAAQAKALGLPYFASLEIGQAFYQNGVTDIFREDFATRLKAYIGQQLAEIDGDPACIGYLMDTVSPWTQHDFLEAPADSDLKATFQQHMHERYKGKLERFAESWNVAVSNWDELRALDPQSVSAESARVRQDCESFTALYTERYLQLTAEVCAACDPERLYCGCVFGPQMPGAGFMTLAGKYCDVVFLKSEAEGYDKETLDQVHEWSGRPLVLVGTGWPEESERSLPAATPRLTNEETAGALKETVRSTALRPYLLGWILENAYDCPASGRLADGAAAATGLMDLTDHLRISLAEAIRAASRDIYGWHLQS